MAIERHRGVVDDARAVAEAGAQMLVLECVPSALAAEITAAVAIPTIGIGAGPSCDGQILVLHDLLGMNSGHRRPRFVKDFLADGGSVEGAFRAYAEAVRSGAIEIVGALNSSGYDGQYGGIYAFGSGQEMIVSRSGNISLQGTSTNSNVAGINVSPGNSSSRLGYDGVNAYTGNITLNANTFISYEGSINANQLELLGSGVSYTLTNTANNVSRLIGNTGSIAYVDADALELGTITTSGALNIATLTGNLTLNGVTKPVVIAAKFIGEGDDPWGGYRAGFEGSTTLTLKEFDIKMDLGPASQTVDLIISVEGVRK